MKSATLQWLFLKGGRFPIGLATCPGCAPLFAKLLLGRNQLTETGEKKIKQQKKKTWIIDGECVVPHDHLASATFTTSYIQYVIHH